MNSSARPLIPLPRSVEYTGGEILLSHSALPCYHLEIAGCDHPVFQQAEALLKSSLT